MSDEEVETGMGPVFGLDETRVRCVNVFMCVSVLG